MPFIRLTQGPEKATFVDEAQSLPIREITVGPTPYADEALRALRGFLDSNGYGDVRLHRSETPFR